MFQMVAMLFAFYSTLSQQFHQFKVPITTQNIRASVTPALDISMTIIFYY